LGDVPLAACKPGTTEVGSTPVGSLSLLHSFEDSVSINRNHGFTHLYLNGMNEWLSTWSIYRYYTIFKSKLCKTAIEEDSWREIKLWLMEVFYHLRIMWW
jgi:hypothetical protein